MTWIFLCMPSSGHLGACSTSCPILLVLYLAFPSPSDVNILAYDNVSFPIQEAHLYCVIPSLS